MTRFAHLLLGLLLSSTSILAAQTKAFAQSAQLDPVPAGCGLVQPAFCDTFDTRHPISGRTGELNPTRWSVARLTQLVNPGQGQLNEFVPTKAMHCKTPVSGVVPESDYFLCGPEFGESMHFMEAFDDNGNYVWNDLTALQPFDFGGRTGTIAFDVDAKTYDAHGSWVEVWLTDEAAPGVHGGAPGSAALPRNGLGLKFARSCDHPGTQMTLYSVEVVRNFVDDSPAFVTDMCVQTMDDMKNHIEIRVSEGALEVWSSDADMTNPVGTNFRRIAHMMGLNLPFARGYVHLQHAQYNAGKVGVSSAQTYHWDNIGFDGPILPPLRAYSVADALTQGRDNGSVNLGYELKDGSPKSFSVADVDPSRSAGGLVTLNVLAYDEQPLRYRLNNGEWHTYTPPFPFKWGVWRTESVPFNTSELIAGTNKLDLSASNEVVANIDIKLQSTDVATPIPSTLAPNPSVTPAPSQPMPAMDPAMQMPGMDPTTPIPAMDPAMPMPEMDTAMPQPAMDDAAGVPVEGDPAP